MATRAEARRRKILENSEDRLKRLTGRLENDSVRDEVVDEIRDQAEVERRAEARRRKILENSEDRLKRFARGLRNESDAEVALDREEKNDRDPEKSQYLEKTDINKDLSGGKRDNEDIVKHNEQEKVQGDGDVFSDSNPIRNIREERSGRQGSGPVNYARSSSTDCNTGVRSRRIPTSVKQSSDLDESSQHSAEESTNSADIIRQIEVTRLVSCVLGAVLSRWLLPTFLGYLVLQSATVLFLAIEAALFTQQRHLLQTVVLPHKNNLMAGALLLCGIKPELITTYNRVMGIATTVFEDLMVYFFTFITCHLLAS
ncbi:guided entry of tail-anchored proteins factor CAMLG-like [Liolophura sinensis]|uniref:guided entry of tail-anchored proteins factor CAMLG-like n=1 Tax=Liolophura sinensis TaxID=3198878 RepID=UPI003158C6FA